MHRFALGQAEACSGKTYEERRARCAYHHGETFYSLCFMNSHDGAAADGCWVWSMMSHDSRHARSSVEYDVNHLVFISSSSICLLILCLCVGIATASCTFGTFVWISGLGTPSLIFMPLFEFSVFR